MGRLNSNESDERIDFSGKQPIPNMRAVENSMEAETALRKARATNPVEHHASDIDDFRERQQKSNADYQSRRSAEESEAAIRQDQQKKDQNPREYSRGTSNAKRGRAKLHKNELVVSGTKVRQVKKTGVQNLKGHEQIIPAAPQPVSRWAKLGPSMDDHLRRLGLA